MDRLRTIAYDLQRVLKALQVEGQLINLQQLEDEPIRLVHNVMQDGWGGATFFQSISTITFPATTSDVFPGNLSNGSSPLTDVYRLVTGVRLVNSVGAVNDMSIIKRKQQGSGGSVIEIEMHVVAGLAVGTNWPWSEVGAGAPYWIFEPASSLRFQVAGSAAGDSSICTCSWIELPNGFKLI